MRIKNAVRNSFFSIVSQIILIVVGFFCQRVMNLRLGEELVGMNSVISNIIALLSVTELGISVAVVFHLYRAVAEDNKTQIAALMNLYRKAYYVFAAAIALLGLAVLPFVPLFLKENSFTLSYIRIIYGLWLLRTVASYLLSYKRSILIADQKEYIVSVCTLLINSLNYVVIIVIVEFTRNYILALALNVLLEFGINLWLNHYIDKKYPFIKAMKNALLQKEIVTKIWQDIKNIFVTRLSAKLLLSTDSLIMSSFINVAVVGLYANYTMITQSLTNIVVACSNALQPTVGNMFIEKDHEKEYGVLRQITFLFFVFASFASVSLFALMTPFVTDIWLDAEYALGIEIIVWCVINFFTNTMCMPLNMMMGVTGLFDKERNISMIAAIVNIVLSLILVVPLGIPGVLLGTFIAYLVQFLYRAEILIRRYMNKNYFSYMFEVLQYAVLTIIEVALVAVCKQKLYAVGSIRGFLLLIGICVLLPNALNFLLFFRSWRFRSIWNMMKELLMSKER